MMTPDLFDDLPDLPPPPEPVASPAAIAPTAMPRLPGHLAAALGALAPQRDSWVEQLLADCVRALYDGDVCLHPGSRADRPADAEARLRASALVGAPGEVAPLILDHGWLYLARYQQFEQRLAEQLLARARPPAGFDPQRARTAIDHVFGPPPATHDGQRLAAASALASSFAIISGGPGTGKTTTVTRLMAALVELGGQPPLRLRLAAPTGKAAARMSESIRQQKARLPLPPALLEQLPDSAQTLHRLLGVQPNGGGFRHHAGRPLDLDVLVIDEASMVDLALLARVVDALPPDARLILLGDKDQLDAVEAGSVFPALCAGRGLDADTRAMLTTVAGQTPPDGPLPASRLGHAVAVLTHSHRFGADSAIGQLARDIHTGNGEAVASRLAAAPAPGGDDALSAGNGTPAALERIAADGYRAYLACVRHGDEPAAVLAAFDRFRVLSAHRDGPDGVTQLNTRIERALHLPADRPQYAGRPVIVRENDYALGLFNGDIGILLETPAGLRAHFAEADGGVRHLSPARLPAHDTAFAMTVHKSQGSEFDRVLCVLPPADSPLATRALFYTAVTRARHAVCVWGDPAAARAAVAHVPTRQSGLARRLQIPIRPA